MLARVLSAALSARAPRCGATASVNGIEALPVDVEVNSGWGDTVVVIVGNKTPKEFVPSYLIGFQWL